MKTAVQIALAATAWLALGIPLWLRTIEVDRADLDFVELQRYEALASQQVETAIRVAVSDPVIPDLAPASELVVNSRLYGLKSSYRFIFEGECTDAAELCIVGRLNDADVIELNPSKRTLEVAYTNTTLINGHVPELVGMLLMEHLYKNEVLGDATNLDFSPHGSREEVTLQYSPQFHLTFSLFSEKGTLLDWNIGSALEEYLGPLLTDLDAGVANITVDAQTALYADISTSTHVDEKTGLRILDQSQLSTFVDFAEWKLTSSFPYPTLNFVLYVPESPITIEDTTKRLPQFIVPQWGGVVIASPQTSGHVFDNEELRPILDVFARQLLALLGMREPTDQPKASRPSTEIMLAKLSRDWAIRGLQGAASSLGSLRRLAASMPHIAIPQKVAQNAEVAMHEINLGLSFLSQGEHNKAAACARKAHIAADRAFFDKHMVAQAYFPDEHKLAVYMPLIGPLCVVVFSGWLRLAKQRKAAKQKKDTKHGKDAKQGKVANVPLQDEKTISSGESSEESTEESTDS